MYIEIEEIRKIHFWDINSLSRFLFVLFHARFFDCRQNLKILSKLLYGAVYNIGCFYLYWFWIYGAEYFHAITQIQRHSQIHKYAQANFQKPFFWTQGASKCIKLFKTRYWKFWLKTILPFPNGSWVMKGKLN